MAERHVARRMVYLLPICLYFTEFRGGEEDVHAIAGKRTKQNEAVRGIIALLC